MSQTRKSFLMAILLSVAGIVAAEFFSRDPDQDVLDFMTYYVTLSTTALSKIHCGLLCVVRLGTCSYYLYDAASNTCYGRNNTEYVPYNPGILTTVKNGTKMIDTTHRQKEFRSCVLEEKGILVGNTSCIKVYGKPLPANKIRYTCKTQLHGHVFEPRTEALSRDYKLPMLERGYNDEAPLWIGLRYDTSNNNYRWISDHEEAQYTDWCKTDCSRSPAKPELPNSQHCVTTVFLLNGPFGWWDKLCDSNHGVICEIPLNGPM